MARVAYLAHPVGHDEDRVQNLINVNLWFLMLIEASDFAINVPWKIYVDNLSEEHRNRGLRDDLEILSRCDIIILCGGKISPGMFIELGAARLKGLQVIDLTHLGYTPDPERISLVREACSALR